MTVWRVFWMLVYPIAVFLHRWGGASYAWVNVGKGAWHREYFDALWHYRWYGTRIERIPDEVNLCGIVYRVGVSEGLVTFVDRALGCRISFDRDSHDQHAHLWYSNTTGRIPADHYVKAYQWVEAVYGGAHEIKAPVVRVHRAEE